jgi:hypothetical protein
MIRRTRAGGHPAVQTMRLDPLYRIRFSYPEGWMIGLDGGWEQHFFIAEGRCEGAISGRFRGANFPRRQGATGPFRPDFRAVIETDDGKTIMVECTGTAGPTHPDGARLSARSSTWATVSSTASCRPTAGERPL